MPKNVQTTVQWCSFHTLTRKCSKSFKLGFNNMWTEKFQIYKLDLEKAREPVIKLPTSTGSLKKQDNSRKKRLFLDYTKAFVWITTNWKILKEMGIPDYLTCLLGKVKKQQLEPNTEQWTGSKLGKEYVKTIYCHSAIELLCSVYHVKC